MRPIVLTVAGSDSSGGAGIQADLAAIAACGGYGACAVTAVTAQNSVEVRAVAPVDPGIVRAQLEAVLDDLDVAAVKSGMLAGAGAVRELARVLRVRADLPYVCDPVLHATAGGELLDAGGLAVLARELLPRATLVTPNAGEASRLTGEPVETPDGAERAARRLRRCGAAAVLVTGGHLREQVGTDVLVDAEGTVRLPGTPLDTPDTHGSGCVYSAAIATHLARGAPLREAVAAAQRFARDAIVAGRPVGRGPGPVDPRGAGAARGDRERIPNARGGS